MPASDTAADLQTATPRRRRPSQSSPSPIIAFAASPLPTEAKGVKDITQQVIKSLEGLGHIDFVGVPGRMVGIDEQSEAVLEDATSLRRTESEIMKQPHGNGHVKTPNGAAAQKKIDWEIPRKLLHSSIGFFTLYLYAFDGSIRNTVLILWSALAIIVPADLIRLRYPGFERLYERAVGFLMRESEKKSTNGVIWYILGVNTVLTFYPPDVAVVAILILSWADTAASTFGRMFGRLTPPLPRRLPLLGLPLAPRKSLAGFIAASLTGACVAIAFWGWIAPLRNNGVDLLWTWQGGVSATSSLLKWFGMSSGLGGASGWTGLGIIGLVSGLVSGVAEALDLGPVDDNLTLPIISGGCILAFFKLIAALS